MPQTKNTYVQPALREPAQSLGTGPLEPEPAQPIAVAYRDLVATLAEQLPMADSIRDLPEHTHAQLATVLRQYPSALIDSLAEIEPDAATLIADRLAAAHDHLVNAYQHVGLCVVGIVRAYLKELVLRDMQAKVERNRELDALEDRLSHREVLTPDAELADELGLGRSLHS